MAGHSQRPSDDRAVGLAALAAVLFCSVTGLGVGAFVQAPVLGTFAGVTVGVLVSVLAIPSLMREWR